MVLFLLNKHLFNIGRKLAPRPASVWSGSRKTFPFYLYCILGSKNIIFYMYLSLCVCWGVGGAVPCVPWYVWGDQRTLAGAWTTERLGSPSCFFSAFGLKCYIGLLQNMTQWLMVARLWLVSDRSETRIRAWRDGSAAKSNCSCREPGFNSKHT